MGRYFVMSTRFNRCSASDFGLVFKDESTAIDPADGSIWIKRPLYDYGWGRENGYYRSPLPDADTLFELALHGDNEEDMYGAAAIILDTYADELLNRCEQIAADPNKKRIFKRMVMLFDLVHPNNRCRIDGKAYTAVRSDYERWARIADAAKKL